MIDPEEMQGPAQGLISRLTREDPSIRTDRPIPIAKLKEAFEQMRSGREGGGTGRSRADTEAQLAEAMSTAPLVPGFGGEVVALEPVLGFGPSAELAAVPVTPADLKEAEERMARYDRNKDGYLSGDEISRRWTGNPMDFDRNGDGKLSLSELAVRAARLRVAQQEVTATNNRRDTDRRRDREVQSGEIPDPYNGRQSFATTRRGLPEGLPSWFADKDTDGDQQVSMAEFASRWTPALIDEFESFDLNGDGFITPQECLAAVRGGATASLGGSSGGSTRGGDSASRYSGRSSRSPSEGRATSSSPSATAPGGEPAAKTLEAATRIVGKNDKNKDGVLTVDEWKDMLIDISKADFNGDGKITALEYAQWMELKQRNL